MLYVTCVSIKNGYIKKKVPYLVPAISLLKLQYLKEKEQLFYTYYQVDAEGGAFIM